MRHAGPILAVILPLLLSACSQTTTNNTSEPALSSDVTSASSLYPLDSTKFQHVDLSRVSAESIKISELIPIDSVFHHQIISQMEGPSLPYSKDQNYFVSIQDDVYDYRCVLVTLYWDVCYEGVYLLLIDPEGVLVNSIAVSEIYSGCETTTETTTQFMSNSTFKWHQILTEVGHTSYITEFEFIGQINERGQVDTLEVLTRKVYDE